MKDKNHLQIIMIASVLTGLLIIFLRYISFPNIQPDGSRINLFIIIAAVIGSNLAAAVPGWLLMRYRKIKRAAVISVGGVCAAFVLHTILGPLFMPLGGWGTWSLTSIAVTVGAYIGVDFILSGRKTSAAAES